MTKSAPQHRDKLGQEINIDDCVAFPVSNSLELGKVIKLNNKMIKVAKIPAGKYRGEWNKYPSDTVKVDSAMITMYILTQGK